MPPEEAAPVSIHHAGQMALKKNQGRLQVAAPESHRQLRDERRELKRIIAWLERHGKGKAS